jgi:hypothetical protein
LIYLISPLLISLSQGLNDRYIVLDIVLGLSLLLLFNELSVDTVGVVLEESGMCADFLDLTGLHHDYFVRVFNGR